METFDLLVQGFQVLLRPENLLFSLVGVFLGTLVGVLPGLGPVATMSLLLPVTYKVTAVQAIIMLAGIYYGTQYGGSTTSILLNIPGEASSVVTCIDGYRMAQKGRAGSALGISAFGSFIGGTVSVVGLMLLAPTLAEVALAFGPPEYFSLLLLGVLLLTHLGGGSRIKSLMMAVAGLLLGTVGLDVMTGTSRFVYGSVTLIDGIGLAPVAMGLFGIAEILMNLAEIGRRRTVAGHAGFRDLLPNAGEWRRSVLPIGRGTLLGFFLGMLPGAGAIMSSLVSYAAEKRLSKRPEEFGKGAIEGVAGPETANNAATGGAFIPLLTLGVPANGVMAILLAAFLIHGLQPGPLLMQQDPGFFWGIIASMYLGNAMLLVLNLPLIGLWVQVLRVPYEFLFPGILLFAVVGAYSVNTNIVEVFIMGAFGVAGFVLRKLDFDCAPLIFGLILSPMLENSFRQSLLMGHGSPMIFVGRPLSLAFLIAFVVVAMSPVLGSRVRARRAGRFLERRGVGMKEGGT